MNNFNGIGRMVKKPDLTYSKSGVAVTKFIIAIDRQFKKDETDFLPVTCFKGVAESTAEYCEKGSKVAVSGNVQTSNYEKDGVKIYRTDIIAQSVEFLDPKPQNTTTEPQTSGDDPFKGGAHDEGSDELPF